MRQSSVRQSSERWLVAASPSLQTGEGILCQSSTGSVRIVYLIGDAARAPRRRIGARVLPADLSAAAAAPPM
jgi:hypothetical protein